MYTALPAFVVTTKSPCDISISGTVLLRIRLSGRKSCRSTFHRNTSSLRDCWISPRQQTKIAADQRANSWGAIYGKNKNRDNQWRPFFPFLGKVEFLFPQVFTFDDSLDVLFNGAIVDVDSLITHDHHRQTDHGDMPSTVSIERIWTCLRICFFKWSICFSLFRSMALMNFLRRLPGSITIVRMDETTRPREIIPMTAYGMTRARERLLVGTTVR